MIAEVVSIGDELTSGQRLDTNSQWLSQQLGEIGVKVVYHSTVADEQDAMVEVFRQAILRADVVVCTGGLGPTADDLTRDVLAQAAGVELVLDSDSLEVIRGMFKRWGRPMAKSNESQAMLPSGAKAIPNPKGTAPGIEMALAKNSENDCHFFAMPGVPAEMKPMWENSVRPAVLALGAAPRVIRHRLIHCFGAGESRIESMLPDLIRRGRTPSVGITVSGATITLRISAEAENADACGSLIRPTAETIYEKLGDLVYGEADQTLQDVILQSLSDSKQTLSTIELGSQGLVTQWLSEAQTGTFEDQQSSPSKRRVYLGGTVQQMLEEGADTLSLARRCRQTDGADYGLAIGPVLSGEDKDRPAQAVVSLAYRDPHGDERTVTSEFTAVGIPDLVRTRLAKQGLNLLRLLLNGASEDDLQ